MSNFNKDNTEQLQAIKEARQPVIPAENWANKDLYHKD